MKSEIAEYILKLERASKETHRAEDRSLYERYIAGAGVLLALVETDADKDLIDEAVDTHQRLWGYTWLQDEVFKVPAEAWGDVVQMMAERPKRSG